MGHLFTAQHQDTAIIARGDRLKTGHQRRGAGGRGGFDANRRHAGQADRIGDQRGDVAVAGKLLGIHRADIKRVNFLQFGLGERQLRRLRKDLGERPRVLAELGHADAGNVNRLHRLINFSLTV